MISLWTRGGGLRCARWHDAYMLSRCRRKIILEPNVIMLLIIWYYHANLNKAIPLKTTLKAANAKIIEKACQFLFVSLFNCMSFCQKHLNHHCVHSHHCSNPHHASHQSQNHKNEQIQLKQACRQSSKDKSCTFQGGLNVPVHHSIQRESNNSQAEQSVRALKEHILRIEQKNKKQCSQIKQLRHQIEGYRQKLVDLIEISGKDNRAEIKKRLKETMDLQLKIKVESSQREKLLVENESLRKIIHDGRITTKKSNKERTDIEQRYSKIYQQLRVSRKEIAELQQQLKEAHQEMKRNSEKYRMFKEQVAFEQEQSRREIRELSTKLDVTSKQLGKLRRSCQEQTVELERGKGEWEKQEENLKGSLLAFKKKNEELHQSLKQANLKCDELAEKLAQAKIAVLKQTSKGQQFEEEERKEEHQVYSKTIIKQKGNSMDEKENQQSKGQNRELQQQITVLKAQIRQLELRNNYHFEEVILNMGASEAFRKLLQEKNTVIKKLIREKGQILNKTFQASL